MLQAGHSNLIRRDPFRKGTLVRLKESGTSPFEPRRHDKPATINIMAILPIAPIPGSGVRKRIFGRTSLTFLLTLVALLGLCLVFSDRKSTRLNSSHLGISY